MKDKIAIITVTYNPNLNEFIRNINSYVEQVPILVVIDNSTDINLVEGLEIICSKYNTIKLIKLGDNFGIAYAQNVGIKYLQSLKFQFVIELDQDSKLEEDYVVNIVKHFKEIKYSIDPDVIALGCLAINSKDGFIYDGFYENVGFKKVKHTLSSGLLIDLEAFYKVGFKDEALFIDLVDWDWCWRASIYGYNTYVDTSLKITHSMGDKHLRIFNFNIGVPKPYRHYYAFRNSLYLLCKTHSPINWKLKVIPLLISKLIFYPLYMENGFLRLEYMIKGIKDFFLNKTGPNK